MRSLLCLLAALHVVHPQALRGLESASASFSSPELTGSREVEEEADVLASVPDRGAGLIPAAYAEYRRKEGGYEVVVKRVPVKTTEDGDELDPWEQWALAEGVDLNDYNVTYPGGSWETLEEDHRRLQVAVNRWENNNARFCQYARQRGGVQQINWSADLIYKCQTLAGYMASVQHISHSVDLADGVDPGWGIICENVCKNTKIGYNGAFMSLMEDPGHYDNIMNARVNSVGIGVVRNGPFFFMCQLFKG